MIQDIAPHQMNISYRSAEPSDDSPIMVFRDGKLLSGHDGMKIIFPKYREVGGRTVCLFSVDDTEYYLSEEAGMEPEGYEYRSMRELRKLKTAETTELFAAFTAYHLSEWYLSNRFCGRCGGRMVHDTTERAEVCPACGCKTYPRINPAVIIGIRNNDRILITKYRTGYAHSALVAGFTEIGETLEDTVRREVMEEVGLKVKNITYYKSQPWGMAMDLLAGFFCDVDGDDRIRMDENELKYAEWVERDKIELQPSDISLTNEMMKVFQNEAGRAKRNG